MLGGLHHAPAAAQPHPDSLLNDFAWRNIGPANMMGRIAAIDALEDDFRTVLIGVASGGVWKSTNAGTSFTPIFDEYGSQSIGDVAFFQGDPDIIWVGTGEASNRNSVGWGDGIYTSTDGGATFTNMGLEDTYQIAAIAPHPRCTSRPSATCGAIRDGAGCLRRPTAGRPGRSSPTGCRMTARQGRPS